MPIKHIGRVEYSNFQCYTHSPPRKRSPLPYAQNVRIPGWTSPALIGVRFSTLEGWIRGSNSLQWEVNNIQTVRDGVQTLFNGYTQQVDISNDSCLRRGAVPMADLEPDVQPEGSNIS